MQKDYFVAFEHRQPPQFPGLTKLDEAVWHIAAGLTIGLGIWYLSWRWLYSLNDDALIFAVAVAGAETAAFLGTLLFFFDIWREGDTPQKSPPKSRSAAHLSELGRLTIDVFVTTYDEGVEVVEHSMQDAAKLHAPENTDIKLHILDDGKQSGMHDLAKRLGATYHIRLNNIGFKAGNIAAAMRRSNGDFVVICDADCRLYPSFLENTLGYFRDQNVAWVQTPHWFYDVPAGRDRALPSGKKRPLRGILRGTLALFLGRKSGTDPFMADPSVFFDIIQRRRNRNHASFCCGAASIHRREAIMEEALSRWGSDAQKTSAGASEQVTPICRLIALQPFRYHVSEDILTSIDLHKKGWKSVYHPKVEARMLSPLSAHAWATQNLKYAGGTFDIMLRHNPLFSSGLNWRTKLHYAATFYSYLTFLIFPH
ncbi:MAG: glycosyltransferase [Rhodobacteraceae bacterium]|nr:glycosyltransferase [Paracoccaceae bacterium]